MFLRADDLIDGASLDADILIIGTGAAGISMALRLEASGLSVLLLESGYEDYDEDIQALYQGSVNGPHTEELDANRLRMFGGSTNHWAGWCRPLDAEDFKDHPNWPSSGWPLSHEDLGPYWAPAAELCALGPTNFDDVAFWQKRDGSGRDLSKLNFERHHLQTALFQISPPINFAYDYEDRLRASQNIRVLLGVTALEIVPHEESAASATLKHAKGVMAGTLDGRRFTISGRSIVVACGGIESARLLLLSKQMHKTGAGNEGDLVGRYFLDHPWVFTAGFVLFDEPGLNWPLYFEEHDIDDARLFGALVPNWQTMREQGLGRSRLILRPSRVSNRGAQAVRDALASLRRGEGIKDGGKKIRSILQDADILADSAWRSITGGNTSPFARSPDPNAPIQGAYVDINCEQQPNRDSRVTLGTQTDAFGQQRVQLDWALTDIDRKTAQRSLEMLGAAMAANNIGTLRLVQGMQDIETAWPAKTNGSRHHSGTARMSDSPESGVTNRWGRLHSVDNVYVSGSALFPTNGFANPTLTIIALALMQADHLAEQMKGQG